MQQLLEHKTKIEKINRKITLLTVKTETFAMLKTNCDFLSHT